jgi:hypothetical protein
MSTKENKKRGCGRPKSLRAELRFKKRQHWALIMLMNDAAYEVPGMAEWLNARTAKR